MNDQIFIQHRFTIEKDGQTLQDAIVLPEAEYKKLSTDDIEVIKQERFDNWKNVVNNPVTIPEPTKEDLIKESESIDEQIRTLQYQKGEVDSKINEILVIESEAEQPIKSK